MNIDEDRYARIGQYRLKNKKKRFYTRGTIRGTRIFPLATLLSSLAEIIKFRKGLIFLVA